MATPEPSHEPTLADVLHTMALFTSEMRLLASEVQSLRRVMLDEFSAIRHLVQALDRDVQGIARRIMEGGEEE